MKNVLLSFYLLIFLLLGGINPAKAAYLRDVPVTIQQPGGTVLNVFATGDEFYYRLHDAGNYTITRDPSSGFYVYAILSGDELVPTSFIVGQSEPSVVGLAPGINISGEKIKQIRSAFLADTPKKPPTDNIISGQLTTGNLNNLVVYIRFSDQGEFVTSNTVYENMFNSSVEGANSMLNYFSEASFNTLAINSSFYPLPNGAAIVSYQDSHPRSYFMPYSTSNPNGYSSSQRTEREHELLANAVSYIASMVPAGMDIDHDGDGYVDNVCFIIKGGTTAWSTLLWPHRWSLYTESAYINGKRVWDYNFQLEDFLSTSGNGVLCHEMFHTLGAPDLYHYTNDGNTPVGSWDIMENNTNPPQSMGAFMKYKYGGWITEIPNMTAGGPHTLNPVTNPVDNCLKLYSPNSSTEYFVFEYRQKSGTFENSIPGSGLLIYRINTAAGDGNADGPPDEVYVYRPGGTTTSNGTVTQANFSSNSGRTVFNNSSNPNCFFSNGVLADIDISNVSEASSTITFNLNIGIEADFSISKTEACSNTTINFTDYSVGGPTTWSWTFIPSTYVFVEGTSANSQNPKVQFTSPGYYDVVFQASSPGGSDTKVVHQMIYIYARQDPPFNEDFESGSLSANNWTVKNPDNATTWSVYSPVGGTSPGTNAIYMDFFDYDSIGKRDYLLLPSIDLSSYGSAQMTFKVAYRQFDNSRHDSLKVYIYTNCGETYVGSPYSKTGSALSTGVATTTEFIPSQASDWRIETINLNPYMGNLILIKIVAVNGNGNNLYLDDFNISASAPIAANFSASATNICKGETVSFTDMSTGNPTAWFWNFGDGTSSNLQNPVHQYNNNSTYNVTLTVYKSNLINSKNKANYITVNPILSAELGITQSPQGYQCTGTPVTFTATPVNPGANPSYEWKRNGITVGTNSPVYQASNFITGEYVLCIMTSSENCLIENLVYSDIISLQVSQSLTPSISVTANPSLNICQGTNVVFSAQPINGGENPVFEWKKNGIVVGANSDTFSDTSLETGDSISCSLSSSLGCVTSNMAYSPYYVMSVTPTNPVSVNISAEPPGPVCAGGNVKFTASLTNQGNQPSFQWKLNGNNVGTNSNILNYNSFNTGDIVECILTSNIACPAGNPATSNMLVMQVNSLLPVSVVIESDPPMPICQGTSVTFTPFPENGGSEPVYTWKKNGIPLATGSTYTVSNLTNGQVITCELNSSELCTSNDPALSNPVTAVVNQSSPLTVSISANPGNSICEGTEVTFIANINQPGTSPTYEWKVNNVTVCTDAVFTISSLTNGNKVKCYVTSGASCTYPAYATSNIITMNVTPQYTVSLDITADPPGIICSGTTVVYTANPTNGGSNPEYAWFLNGNLVSSGSSFSSNSIVNGDEIVCFLNSSISGCVNGNPAIAVVYPQVQEPPVINLGCDTILSGGVSLLLNPGSGFASYLWNTGATTQTIQVTVPGTYSVTVTDIAGCTGTDEISVTIGFGSLEGNVCYLNQGSGPLSNIQVRLMQGAIVVKTAMTDAAGFYQITDIAPGNYTINPTTNRPWGGVNSTDALLVMKHFVGITPLSGLKYKAADVNNSIMVNSMDALTIQRRYINQISSFPVPDWQFDNPSILISPQVNEVQNIKALCSGDVNGSYSPPARKEPGIQLIPLNSSLELNGNILEVPLYAGHSFDASAISLKIAYNPLVLRSIDLLSASLDHSNLVFSLENNLVSISWFNLENRSFLEGDEIFRIKFEVRDFELFAKEGFSLNPLLESEISDENAVEYDKVSFTYPSFLTKGVAKHNEVGHYPNPVDGNATFWFSLSDDSPVNIRIFDVNQHLVFGKQFTDFTYGYHTWSWNTTNLKGNLLVPGVYFYQVSIGSWIKSGKLVLIRN